MTGPVYRVADRVFFLLFMKLRGRDQKGLGERLATAVQGRVPGDAPLFVKKVFHMIGKWDLGFLLAGGDHGALSRYGYNLLDYLKSEPGVDVLDFTRLPLFAWEGLLTPRTQQPSVALLQLKLKTPLSSFETPERTALVVLKRLSAKASFSVYAGLGWHEIVVDVAGRSFDDAKELVRDLVFDGVIQERVAEISSIPVWQPLQHYGEFSGCLNVFLKVQEPRLAASWFANNEFRRGAFGFIDAIEPIPLSTVGELEAALASFEDDEAVSGMRKYSSLLSWNRDAPEEETRVHRQAERRRKNRGGPKLPLTRLSLPGTGNPDIDAEKFDAFRVQVEVLQADDRFGYLLPPLFVDTIRGIARNYSALEGQDVQGYISSLRQVLQERLRGTYPAAATGFVTGYADGYGGCQRLLIACETLFESALRIMVGSAIEKVPPILVVFDHSALQNEDYSVDEGIHEYGSDAPVIVRLPFFRYEPWTWHRGLRVVAQWCAAIELQLRGQVASLLPPSRAIPEVIGHYVGAVLRRETYTRLLAFENPESPFLEQSDGRFKVDDRQKSFFDKEVEAVADAPKKGYSTSLEDTYRARLASGELVLGELADDLNFVHFVNAYYSMPLHARRTPQAAMAFVMSTYARTRHVQERRGQR